MDDSVYYRGFSCPHEGLNVEFMEQIAVSHYRRALRTFLSRYADDLEKQGSGALVSLYRRWFDIPTSFDTIWDASFGKMREILMAPREQVSQDEVTSVAVQLGVRLGEIGMDGEWAITLKRPCQLRWGQWLLPRADRFEVSVESGKARLILFLDSERQVVNARRNEQGWEVEGAEAIPQLGIGLRNIGILLPHTPQGQAYKEAPFEVDGQVRQEIWSAYHSLVDVLRQYAPIYLPWINCIARYLVPIQAPPGGFIGGGSFRDDPGTIKLPFSGPPVGLAANMVHECTHQYYFLLRSAGRVDDGSDTNLYYSPFVKKDRDLTSITLTYHAFANEALVSRMCELAGIDDPYAGERAALLRRTLAPLEEILVKSTAFTPLGRGLWEPVYHRLQQAFSPLACSNMA